MDPFIILAAIISLIVLIWRGSSFLAVSHGKIYFDPVLFFLIGYFLLAFIPHFCIYTFPAFESFYVTFSRGETGDSLLAACVFGVVWACTVSFRKSKLSSLAVTTFEVGGSAPRLAGGGLLSVGLLLLVSVALNILLFGISGSVGAHLVGSVLRRDLSVFYADYNQLRYAATTQPFLESGIRGVGTLTSTMTFCVYAAVALGFHLTKGVKPLLKLSLRCILIVVGLFIAFATGTRTSIVYFILFATVVLMILEKKNDFRSAIQGIFAAVLILTGFTALTPKSQVGNDYNAFEAIIYRLAGNAVNDATIIQAQSLGEYTFTSSLLMMSEGFEPLDRQLTYFYTEDSDLPWYETPTCLAGYFVSGGFLFVALNAAITGLVCRFLSYLVRREQDPRVVVPLFAAACVINLQMPLTGWFSPAIIIGAFLSFGLLKVLSLLSRGSSHELSELSGTSLPVPECDC
jgi:oligosaccharide repeat unit polymerase